MEVVGCKQGVGVAVPELRVAGARRAGEAGTKGLRNNCGVLQLWRAWTHRGGGEGADVEKEVTGS